MPGPAAETEARMIHRLTPESLYYALDACRLAAISTVGWMVGQVAQAQNLPAGVPTDSQAVWIVGAAGVFMVTKVLEAIVNGAIKLIQARDGSASGQLATAREDLAKEKAMRESYYATLMTEREHSRKISDQNMSLQEKVAAMAEKIAAMADKVTTTNRNLSRKIPNPPPVPPVSGDDQPIPGPIADPYLDRAD